MDGLVAYILAEKLVASAASGISNITTDGNQLIFQFKDGTSIPVPIPLPENDIAPTIDPITKHWLIGELDTGVIAEGKDGLDGKGITEITKIETDGLIDTYKITFSDNTIFTYKVKNGEQGIPGQNGITYKPVIGNVVSGAEAAASIIINDETKTVEFNFVLPRGEKGDSGQNSNGNKLIHILEIEDGISIYDTPIDNVDFSIYLNGIFLTENIDYTIDKTNTPNQITFKESLDKEDLCVLVWSDNEDGLKFASKNDIDKMF